MPKITNLHLAAALTVCLLVFVSGCGQPQLMMTPNLYSQHVHDGFENAPHDKNSTDMQILYFTDRMPIVPNPDKTPIRPGVQYSAKRANFMAFGVGTVQIGTDLTWEQLVEESQIEKRTVPLPLKVVNVEELGQSPKVPREFFEPIMAKDTGNPQAYEQTMQKNFEILSGTIEEYARKSGNGEVYFFVHGFNNTFDQSMKIFGQLWHFLGRRGIPIVYSWPAGAGGLRGYFVDSDSGDASVGHLMMLLPRLASCPSIKSINIISHSRGTDVTCKALKDLNLQFKAAGKDGQKELKLKNLILLSPDIDPFFLNQRILGEGVHHLPLRITVYTSAHDQALGLSTWLRGGVKRLGQLQSSVLTKEQVKGLAMFPQIDAVFSHARKMSFTNHSYYLESPAVSSDLILLLRYGLGAGKENGRPLERDESHGWILKDGYPYEGYQLPGAAGN